MADEKKLLVFIVAYNAEKTIASVLGRIPMGKLPALTDILVIDDSSADSTFDEARKQVESLSGINLRVLYNPVNQGYGGNQKLGYQYALEMGYDAVVLLHGDGQYAPERMPDLVEPVLRGDCDACFGSRMIERGGARRGGMPLYKYGGNRILSYFQNRLLGMHMSEFHSGYRAYSADVLKKIPFHRNSNDFHFDTEIIIQILAAGGSIREVPIPTYYGDEICYVNGIKYAWNVVKATMLYRCHRAGILHQPQYELYDSGDVYQPKDSFYSSHSLAVEKVNAPAEVLDVAGGVGHVAEKLRAKGCRVTGVDRCCFKEHKYDKFLCHDVDGGSLPSGLERYDYILLLDCLEHFSEPEKVLESLRNRAYGPSVKVFVSVPNIAFFINRIALFAGSFNYGRRGILDRTHVRLFTFGSLRRMLVQEGFVIDRMTGVPAPFPLAAGKQVGGFLVMLNRLLIYAWKRLFSYQIFAEARMLPPVTCLLERTLACSEGRAGKGQG